MKVSGFTIVRNISQYNYPVKEAISSVLPICDEFIVNVGDSDDDTLEVIESIKSPKIKIFRRTWDMSQREKVLAAETNFALKQCSGDWAFYIQADELVHEGDLPKLKRLMRKHLYNQKIDGFKFRWFHFYGSFYRYRVDAGWYQKQDRIIRNNGTIESIGDAWGFAKKDKTPLNTLKTNCYIYHYGWVNEGEVMQRRQDNAAYIWHGEENSLSKGKKYRYADLKQFSIYFGSHPKIMEKRISKHVISKQDYRKIEKSYWWNPLFWLRVRYKTPKRVKRPLPK
jgi:glycosyltransferase involved in cell wall biosynthesis